MVGLDTLGPVVGRGEEVVDILLMRVSGRAPFRDTPRTALSLSHRAFFQKQTVNIKTEKNRIFNKKMQTVGLCSKL